MFPALLLKQTSVDELKRGVYRAFEHAVQSIPGVVSDPALVLEDIVLAARRTLQLADRVLSRGAPGNDERGNPFLLKLSQRRIVAVLRQVISCELSYGYFQGAADLDELFEAIHSEVLTIAGNLGDEWQSQESVYAGGPALSLAYLPRDVLSNIFLHLGVIDFIQAAKTCEHWLSVALDPANSDLRAFAHFLQTDECDVIDGVDLFTHEPTVLDAWLVADALLYTPSIRLVRPSRDLFLRAVAALPHAEPLSLRVYDATPGHMHFAVGTAAGCFRECVNVDWDLWCYVDHCPAARKLMVRRVHEVAVSGPVGSLDNTIKQFFPCAETREMRIEDHREVLDRPASQTEPHSGAVSARLVWSRRDGGP